MVLRQRPARARLASLPTEPLTVSSASAVGSLAALCFLWISLHFLIPLGAAGFLPPATIPRLIENAWRTPGASPGGYFSLVRGSRSGKFKGSLLFRVVPWTSLLPNPLCLQAMQNR